jgi:hypothetical protein
LLSFYVILFWHCPLFTLQSSENHILKNGHWTRNVGRNCNIATLREVLMASSLSRWHFLYATYMRINEQGYSDWLRAGHPMGRISSPCRVNNFLFSTFSRPAMGPTQPLIQRVAVNLSPRVNRQGLKLTTHLQQVPRTRNVDVYVHFTIRLHGVVLMVKNFLPISDFDEFFGKV